MPKPPASAAKLPSTQFTSSDAALLAWTHSEFQCVANSDMVKSQEKKLQKYDEVLREVYCFFTIGESDSNPEMSRQEFASRMRWSIDEIIRQQGDRVALQRLREFGKKAEEAWLERCNGIQNLGKAEKYLQTAAKRLGNIRRELAAGHAQTHISKAVEPQLENKKRKLNEVEEQVEKAAELCKRMKREE